MSKDLAQFNANLFDFKLNSRYILIMMNKLKELREKRGLSQAEVAQEIGISRQMYNKYERGDTEPSLSSIKALCTLYAVSYEELLDSNGEQKSKPTYNIDKSVNNMVVSSPSVAYGTENYFAQIMNLLPHLLLSEKSRLLTAVSQSITEEVEVQARTRKSQPMKVNWDDVKIPTEEEFEHGFDKLLAFADSIDFNTHGVKWTREELHER